MNVIAVSGMLGRDAEIRYMSNGDPVASFSVADSQGKDKPAIWWSASLFGKRAESLSQYLVKGAHVTVTGYITQRTYTDKNGQERTAQEIRVNDLALQGGKRDSGDTQRVQEPAKPAAKPTTKPANTGGSGFDDMDDDIPF